IYLYSYFINKYFVFNNYEKKHVRHGVGFIVMRLVLLLTINIIVYLGVDVLGFNYLVFIMATMIGEAVVSFLIMKFFLFRPSFSES
ncbi:GtrA family protein, partial [Vibrio sp. 10N.222.48.A4]